MSKKVATPTDRRTPVLRLAQLTDATAVKALALRNGLTGELHTDAWHWLWTDNPNFSPEWSIGWVLEVEQLVVGYIGNVPRRYRAQGRPVLVACARAFVVDTAFRRHALKLIAAFFAQETAALFLFTGANPMAAPLYEMAQAKRLPQAEFNEALYWVVSAGGLIGAALAKRKVPLWAAKLVSAVAGPLIDLGLWFSRPKFKRNRDLRVAEIPATEIGPAFDDLWARWSADAGDACTAERSAIQLRWQFGHPAIARAARLVGVWQADQLMGYVILTRWDAPAVGLRRLMIADLIAIEHRPALVQALMLAALAHARATDVHVVQCTGLPSAVRESMHVLGPRQRTLTDSAFYYFSKCDGLTEALSNKTNWYASMLDGDTSL